MSKLFKVGTVLSLTAALLVGCGSDKAKEQNEDKTASAKTETVIAGTMVVTNILDQLEVDSVIGVPTSTEKMPERYKDVTEIGNAMYPDMEVVKSLNPSKFISVTTLQYDLEPQVKEVNVDSDFINLQSVGEMKKEITRLGKAFHREEQANALVGKYDKKIKEVKDEVKGLDQPKVLILLGVPGSYLVATEHSYVGDLVKVAGGAMAIEGPSEEYLSSNTEYLQQSKPDVILRLSHGAPEEVVDMFNEEFKTNDIWKHFDAVKNDRVYDLDNVLFGTTASLNVGEALDELVKILHEK